MNTNLIIEKYTVYNFDYVNDIINFLKEGKCIVLHSEIIKRKKYFHPSCLRYLDINFFEENVILYVNVDAINIVLIDCFLWEQKIFNETGITYCECDHKYEIFNKLELEGSIF